MCIYHFICSLKQRVLVRFMISIEPIVQALSRAATYQAPAMLLFRRNGANLLRMEGVFPLQTRLSGVF